MMDSSETRPHRTTTTTTTTSLFICFTSRPSSSSSMKIPSTSPGRARDTPASLSASLSRRLKSNGSLKGGHQSPMFPVAGGGKRRGFENPEPSSPKVTCIGQVRVKTKKQGKKIRTLSRRRTRNSNALNSGGNQPESGGVAIHHRNQRWVHLPLTICEALRKGFGAEFSCLFPCRPPSCLRWGKEGSERGRKGSCGVVLVSLNEEGREREVEEFFDNSGSFRAHRLILGDQSPGVEGVEERREIRERISLRRHEDDEEEEFEMFEGEKCEGAGGRLSICAPPKNALLLMRSRSDPVRVSALAARFWEEPTAADKCEEEGDDCDKDEEDDEVVGECEVVKVGLGLTVGKKVEEPEKLGLIDQFCKGEEEGKAEPDVGMVVEEGEGEENTEEGKLEINEEMRREADEQENQGVEEANQENPEFLEENPELEAEEVEQENQEAVADPASFETEDALLIGEGKQDDALEQERGESNSSSVLSVHLFSEVEEEETEESTLSEEEENALEEMEAQDSPLKVEAEEEEEEEILTQERSESEQTQEEAAAIFSSEEREEHQEQEERESNDVTPLLPDCLLLMRCEPKLSMEVSKETWVCTTDFIRWLPGRPQPKASADGGAEPKKKKRVGSTDSNPAPYQLPRSSCSLPAAQAGQSRRRRGWSSRGWSTRRGLRAVGADPV
ncbi:hypothetical protein C3L33_10014, partial [Rhododendron williamsianum]